MNDYEQALARARREGKRVFIDFTGYTCTNCRWMEANMFPREDVRRELAAFVRVRLYTDGDGDLFQRQQQLQQDKYQTVALPFYAVVNADGSPVVSFSGLTRDPAPFLAFLRQGAATPAVP
jgi:thiol:disulfide interchange protein